MSGIEKLNPIVSIVLEGYNQSRGLGEADDTLDALKQQDYPLDHLEIILVGSHDQVEAWENAYRDAAPFKAIKTVACDGAHYYQLKNEGANLATGDIIAFTDSDVRPRPTWVRAIIDGIEAGADVTVGPSLFRKEGRFHPDSILMRMAATITWGWIFGKSREDGLPNARGFMDHNVAMRTEVFRKHQYRVDFGRVIASPLLYRSLVNAGYKVAVQPKQQAAHHFSWRYWFVSLEYRYGFEVYCLRRLDKDYPNQWITKTGYLEPIVSWFWHVLLDMPKWFRFNRVLGTGKIYATLWFPVFVLSSMLAHTFEMAGMYATIFAPEKTRKWAETV